MMVVAEGEHEESREAEDPWTGHDHMSAHIGDQVSLLEELGGIFQIFGRQSQLN
jgi:hypothetical protein